VTGETRNDGQPKGIESKVGFESDSPKTEVGNLHRRPTAGFGARTRRPRKRATAKSRTRRGARQSGTGDPGLTPLGKPDRAEWVSGSRCQKQASCFGRSFEVEAQRRKSHCPETWRRFRGKEGRWATEPLRTEGHRRRPTPCGVKARTGRTFSEEADAPLRRYASEWMT